MPFQKMNIQTGVEVGRRLSWSGIIAGLLIATAIQITLSFLGTSCGLMTVSPYDGALPMGITFGAGMWWVLTTMVAYFLGGWVAGHLRVFSTSGALHGIGTWAATTVVSILLMTVLLGGAGMIGATSLNPQLANNSLPGTPGMTEPLAQPSVREITPANQSQLNPAVDVQAAKHAAAKTAVWAFLASALGAFSAAWGGARAARVRDFVSESAFREWEHHEAA